LTLDGKAVAQKVLDDVRAGVARLKDRSGIVPTLAVVLVGDFAPSKVYVANKKRAADTVGIASQDHIHPEGLDRAALLALLGRLLAGSPTVVPCTPAGCLEILDHYGCDLKGAEAVVIGRSRLVGKPLAHLLLARHATVTMCHTRTRDVAAHTRRADVLCVAAGRPRTVTGDMVKEGAWVVDVGINRLETGKLVGDVDFASVAPRARAITPVPGGVGPMTIAMLLRNTLRAAERQLGVA